MCVNFQLSYRLGGLTLCVSSEAHVPFDHGQDMLGIQILLVAESTCPWIKWFDRETGVSWPSKQKNSSSAYLKMTE